jgi:hypothetical protein
MKPAQDTAPQPSLLQPNGILICSQQEGPDFTDIKQRASLNFPSISKVVFPTYLALSDHPPPIILHPPWLFYLFRSLQNKCSGMTRE